jgi:hypothetical protein
MLKYSESNFITTVSTKQNLHLYRKNLKAICTLLMFIIFAVCGIVWARQLDTKEVENNLVAITGNRIQGKRRSFKLINQCKVEDCLPSIFKSKPIVERVFEEIKAHHKWFAVKYYFSESFPRPFRELSLISSVVVFIFIQSITYNLTNPDDGSCDKLTSEGSCLIPKSPYGTGNSKCVWLQSRTCTFDPPSNRAQVVLFVAIFSVIVGTPIILLINWAIHNILCSSSSPKVSKSLKSSSYLPTGSLMLNNKLNNTKSCFVAALQNISELSVQIKLYREILTQSKRQEFDGIFNIVQSVKY